MDTFGQNIPLVAFHQQSQRPNSQLGANIAADGRPINGFHVASGSTAAAGAGTPPEMYAGGDAPMATEEFTGTNTAYSSPSKVLTSARSNNTGAPTVQFANTNNSSTKAIHKKGFAWLLASAIAVIFVLLILIAFLLYKVHEQEQDRQYFELLNSTFSSSSSTSTFSSSTIISPQVQQRPKGEKNINIENGEQLLKWPLPNYSSHQSRFKKAAVVSENGFCSEIGRDVLLQQGGNAVDAAIAVAICIGALNGHSAGIGGGFLMTYYQRFYGKCSTVDARETAPLRAHKDMFNGDPYHANYGYKSVAVPGEIHGFWTAFKRFGSGKIAWMDLLMPTVNLLNNGYPASKLMEISLRIFEEQILNGSHPGMKAQFVNPGTAELYREGEIIRNVQLAETLKRIALSHDPVHLFYNPNGEIAKQISDEFAQNDGLIARKDLAMYRSVVDELPLLADAVHPELVFCGPKPSSGFALTQLIVAIMLKFYPPGNNLNNNSAPLSTMEYYHKFIEAQKQAFALRTKLGDTKFLKEAEILAENMTKHEFLDKIVTKIGDRPSAYSDFDFAESANGSIEIAVDKGGTSHIVVVDSDGNSVSMTNSVNNPFGSLIRSPSLGIIWNDHMADFSVPNSDNNTFGFVPSQANFILPGKRPMSSMSPLIAFQRHTKEVKLSIGASGGPKIPSAVAQVLVQMLAFNQSLKEAIDTPRLHNQFTPLDTEFEKGFPDILVRKLSAFGHQLQPMHFPIACVHGIVREDGPDGYLLAANDHRRAVHNYPIGY